MASGVDPAKERMMTMAEEWTLVLVKPDGVKNRHVGEVITRIERKGYQIIDLKMIEPTENKLRQHYADKVNEPYFAGLMSYMTEGPIVGIIVAGTNVVKAIHRMAGATIPLRRPGAPSGATLAANGRTVTCATSFIPLTTRPMRSGKSRFGFRSEPWLINRMNNLRLVQSENIIRG